MQQNTKVSIHYQNEDVVVSQCVITVRSEITMLLWGGGGGGGGGITISYKMSISKRFVNNR